MKYGDSFCIGGGTGGGRGTCPPLVRICLLVTTFKLSGTVTFLTILRRWNTCSDGSAIPEHGERRSKNTRARYSSGIESKYKFGTHHHRCPPSRKYLPPPMFCRCTSQLEGMYTCIRSIKKFYSTKIWLK